MAENAGTLSRHTIPINGKTSISNESGDNTSQRKSLYKKTKGLTVHGFQFGSKSPTNPQVAVIQFPSRSISILQPRAVDIPIGSGKSRLVDTYHNSLTYSCTVVNRVRSASYFVQDAKERSNIMRLVKVPGRRVRRLFQKVST